MIRVEVVAPTAGRPYETPGDLVRIGRAEDNDVVVPELSVSGEHARIEFAGDHWVVRDLHSTNGTRLSRGGVVLPVSEAPGREAALQSGDVLLLGDPERPARLLVTFGDEEDDARIVSLRRVAEVERVAGDAQSIDRDLLRRLYEAQRSLSAALDVDDVLEALARHVFELLPRATHLVVALREDDDRPRTSRYVPVGTWVRGTGRPVEPVPVTRSVVRKVVSERAAVLAADARRDVGETASLMAAQIQSTIGVPLWLGEEILGVLQVDNRAAPGMFRERDLDVLLLLAQPAAQAFRHARLFQRLRVAEERARNEAAYLKGRDRKSRAERFIGESPAMQRVIEAIRKVADTRVTVLVEGETGTGKELVASAVHDWSPRADKLFVAQNCAAMPENLLESELFGHRKGAFTGATEDKKGLFEIADGGTLFLDEIGELPLALQPKLLRVLQEGEIRPVGSNTTRRVDVRIVAATNRDLEREVREGRFREDLYYRLRVFPIRVPPLRERREDIPLLARHFLERYAAEFGRDVGGISQQALEVLQAYAWPGNVRELQNEMQRIVITLEDGEYVQVEHVGPRVRQIAPGGERLPTGRGTLRERVEQFEKRVLIEALQEHGHNKTATARALGITREGLHKKLKSYGLG
ncbi:MAG: sigma 54-interacting transcriptional regulator [Myxococcota bacterium]|nr:sigma 54-interacting transcriptional regulator [Myxococcota bacterium]MDW8361691.1 sigma 54-interacting transcriptional regulator [Myxococcales bacterium]